MEYEFYIDKYCFLKKDEKLDLSFVPSLLKRRLNSFDKKILYALQKVYNENVENIILSSRFGECERLVKLIEQYKNENEVSPSLFSASVHNYILGQFCVLNNLSLPYFALSGGEKSFSSGFMVSILQTKKNLIYIFEDEDVFCFNINKEKKGQKYVLIKGEKKDREDNPYSITEKNEASFSNFEIRKVL